MSSKVNELATILGGLESAMVVLQQGMELKAQSSRLRNIFSGNDVDKVLVTTVAAMRQLGNELKRSLEDAE